MRIDLLPTDSWARQCEIYRLALEQTKSVELASQDQVQIFQGFGHALFETAHGLAKLYAHKKTIAMVGTTEPALESLAIAFSEEEYSIHRFPLDNLEACRTWLEENKNNLAFVLMSEDDPITGRLNPIHDFLQLMQPYRIFRIQLSHAQFRFTGFSKPGPYDVRLYSLSPDRCLMIAGERYRALPVAVDQLPWSSGLQVDQVGQSGQAGQAVIEGELSLFSSDQKSQFVSVVARFESNLPPGFVAYFGRDGTSVAPARVMDRIAIYHPQIDGSALIHELSLGLAPSLKEMKMEPRSAFATTSPCSWNSIRMKEWLLARGEAPEIVRGFVLIDARVLLAAPNFREELVRAARVLLELGAGG